MQKVLLGAESATMITNKLALKMLKTMMMVMVLTIQVNHNGDNNNYDDHPITMIIIITSKLPLQTLLVGKSLVIPLLPHCNLKAVLLIKKREII